jgi:hypothetical protein
LFPDDKARWLNRHRDRNCRWAMNHFENTSSIPHNAVQAFSVMPTAG